MKSQKLKSQSINPNTVHLKMQTVGPRIANLGACIRPAHPDEDEEKLILLNRIKETEFKKSPVSRKCLDILFEHRETYITEVDLAEELYDEAHNDIVSTKTRTTLSQIRPKLVKFASTDCEQAKWRMELPLACEKGHKIRFINITNEAGMAVGLWREYFGWEPIIVINEPPVLWVHSNELTAKTFHHIREAEDNALESVGHGQQGQRQMWRFPYMFVGEILARDHFLEWLREHGVSGQTLVSRSVLESHLKRAPAILLGDDRSNGLTRQILRLRENQHLSYRFEESRVGAIEIVEPNPIETETFNAIVRESPESVEKTDRGFVLLDKAEREGNVYALVTRVPNPYEVGAITMIGSGYPRALGQIARTLTDEAVLRDLVTTKLGWPLDEPFPERFQWIFSVGMGKLAIDGEMHNPKLVCWRSYE